MTDTNTPPAASERMTAERLTPERLSELLAVQMPVSIERQVRNHIMALERELAEAKAALSKVDEDPNEVQRAFDQHLTGCAIFEEQLRELGLTSDDDNVVWTNTRAKAAEARAETARADGFRDGLEWARQLAGTWAVQYLLDEEPSQEKSDLLNEVVEAIEKQMHPRPAPMAEGER